MIIELAAIMVFSYYIASIRSSYSTALNETLWSETRLALDRLKYSIRAAYISSYIVLLFFTARYAHYVGSNNPELDKLLLLVYVSFKMGAFFSWFVAVYYFVINILNHNLIYGQKRFVVADFVNAPVDIRIYIKTAIVGTVLFIGVGHYVGIN